MVNCHGSTPGVDLSRGDSFFFFFSLLISHDIPPVS